MLLTVVLPVTTIFPSLWMATLLAKEAPENKVVCKPLVPKVESSAPLAFKRATKKEVLPLCEPTITIFPSFSIAAAALVKGTALE